jgi:diguanylate cyclase (GGDEF)-like protein/PAS domain S-box-containing protein
MDGNPKKDLAEELGSLRNEIAHLQKLIQNPLTDVLLPDNHVLKDQTIEDRSIGDRLIQGNPPEAPDSAKTKDKMRLPPGLLEEGPLGIALINEQFQIAKTNKTFCRMLCYTEAETESLHIQDMVQDPTVCMQIVRQIFDGVVPISKIEEPVLRKGGESFWAQCMVSAIPESTDEPKYCMVLIEDISDRKWAERTLQTEKQLLEWLINSSVDGILAFDRDGFVTVWNPGMERIFGVSAKDTLGRPAFLACPFLKELGEEVNFVAALSGKKVISRDKCYTIPGANATAYFEGYYGPMHNSSGGEVIGGLAIFRDITKGRLAEQGKRASEERYRELFENAYDMVYTYDLSGKITSINKAAERILGYTRAEALKMRFIQFVAPEFQQSARRMIDRQIADEAPVTQEIEIIVKDGSRITLEVSNRLIFQEGQPVGTQGIARDITERKKTEEALQHANKKLEAWVQELEQRTREMTLLSEMGDILRACLTTEEVYEVIERVSQEIFPAQGGALYVMGPRRNIVEAVAEWGETSRIESTFTPDGCWALRRGRVHWVEDTNVGLLCKHLSSPPPKGYLCVPMMAQSEAVGVLHLAQGEASQMPEAKQRLAMAMAERVAMALSNLKLHETLRNQSIHDQLTGLFNRSFLEESLELELRRAARIQGSLCAIMLALDNFQMINENFGAETGDSILRRTGMLIQANVRKGDIACRYSGHTFVIILPQTGYDIGRMRAGSLCNLARTLEIKSRGEQVGQISASAGLAVFPGNGQTVEALLRSAEAALSRASSAGGDCVIVAS